MSKGQKRRLTRVSPRLKMELLSNKRRRWATARSKEQGGACYWCGKPFLARPGLELTADHLIPLSRNGEDHFENIVAAHRRCNEAKGDRLPEEFSEPGKFFWKPKGVPA